MIREIVHDPIFLAQKSVPATAGDTNVADDLLDTFYVNMEKCAGMAANMIGELKRIIIFDDGGTYVIMFNPEILAKKEAYETQEGCLSLSGERKTKRFKRIKVRWQDEQFKAKIKTFSGFTAQIIQHEIDHLNGILI